MSQDPNQEPLVRLDVSGGLAIVTLNRPRAYNAINLLLAESLVDILIRCDEDRQVRAVLVTGAGPAFCSGGDIRQMQEYVARDGDGGRFLKSLTVYLHAAITTISHMQKPVVMAVNGPAAGAGFSLAIAGDLLLAAETATFTVAYTAIALSPDGGSTFHLPRLIGPKLAFELASSNRRLSATEARDLRIVSKVFAADQFLAEATAYASALACGPTEALSRAKRLIATGTENTLETQMEYERQAIGACGRTADFKVGVTAFLEKRVATYHGR